MTAKILPEKRLELIRKVLQGMSVSAICKEEGISRVIFYRWLTRYKKYGKKGLVPKSSGRPAIAKKVAGKLVYTKLSSTARLCMVKEVLDQDQDITDVAKKYNISRVTLYKWLKRYKEDIRNGISPEMRAKVPYIEHYYRETPENYQEVVLSLVAKHPEFGIRSIVNSLPKVGQAPIVGHHGVQNILKRHGLLHFQERLAYAKSQETAVTVSIRKVLEPLLAFFKIQPEARSRVMSSLGTAAFLSFFLVVALGGSALLAGNISSAIGISKTGLIFAGISLVAGSIFFLYSLKYYLTLVIVLSYSQKSSLDKKQGFNFKENLISKILGLSKVNDQKRGQLVPGLEPDLSHVILKRKPYVSVHIPFYNEKNVVRRSIEAAINFKYPEYEIILCDDSTDSTTDIIREYMKLYLVKGEKFHETKNEKEGWSLTSIDVKPGVTLKHLHRTTRNGYKGKALALALKMTDPRTEFVSIFDADFVPYPDSLELFLKYFKVQNDMNEDYRGSKVAAVQGYQWHVLNKSENWITRGVRSEYAGSYVIERSGIEIYGGLKQISGSVYMIKKNVLDEVGWGSSITEDFELTLQLYARGYKVLYTPYVQAPAECVSTLKRLVRQRMRWAEGHSFNIKKMFKSLIFSQRLSFPEKLEFLYLSPYYLQAFFFITGTLSWLISETIFGTHLPFWTELWGWSLVLTNMFALPLVNGVGLFIEESEDRDYMGLGSFIALSYILVPFQAFASIKGLLESREGPWFRTPKTGRITDVFSRGRFYKFIAGILPGKVASEIGPVQTPSPYLALSTANNHFGDFAIKPKKASSWVGKVTLVALLVFTLIVYSYSHGVPEVLATNPAATQYLSSSTTTTLTNSWKLLSSTQTQNATTTLSLGKNAIGTYQYYPGTSNSSTGTMCGSSPNGNGWILDTPFGASGGSIASGTWSFYIKETDSNTNLTGHIDVCVYEVTLSDSSISSNTLLYSSNDDATWSTSDIWNAGASSYTETTSSQNQFNISAGNYLYIEYWNHITGKNSSTSTSTFYVGASSSPYPNITFPTITIPENSVYLLVVAPLIPLFAYFVQKRYV